MILHVTPINDLKDHEDSTACICMPSVRVLEGGDIIVVHNSFDGREGLELANEVLNE